MGILDWFINRPAQFDPERASDALTLTAIEKAVALVDPRLKLVPSYRERLAPAVEAAIRHLRATIAALPPSLDICAAAWSGDAQLRAFFVAAADITTELGRSRDLRKLFDKHPGLEVAHVILGMDVTEARVDGISLHGDVVRRGVAQTTMSFSQHRTRMCGQSASEVLRLLGTQMYEYLVAQALAAIGEERSERRELADRRALLQARLRLLREHGPGLGSLFGEAPTSAPEAAGLEARLLENERLIEAGGNGQSALAGELEMLCEVLRAPERYVRVEQRSVCLSRLNVVVEDEEGEPAGTAERVSFAVAQLTGTPALRRAFVLGEVRRSEMPPARIDFAEAARAL